LVADDRLAASNPPVAAATTQPASVQPLFGAASVVIFTNGADRVPK
jgi:hypothetical protein